MTLEPTAKVTRSSQTESKQPLIAVGNVHLRHGQLLDANWLTPRLTQHGGHVGCLDEHRRPTDA